MVQPPRMAALAMTMNTQPMKAGGGWPRPAIEAGAVTMKIPSSRWITGMQAMMASSTAAT